MTVNRRTFVAGASAMAAGALVSSCGGSNPAPAQANSSSSSSAALHDRPDSWQAVRDQFSLSRDAVHFASFLLASHPRVVGDAIERHRRGLDADPFNYVRDNHRSLENAVLARGAEYLGVAPAELALTDSTTMGLGLLYQGFKFKAGQEVLTTPHDHYSTHESLHLRAARRDVTVRYAPLFDQPSEVTEVEVISRLTAALGPATRVLAVTWVHSNSGVKLPIRAMADALRAINAERDEEDRVLLCVDGVHGLGVEIDTLKDLDCDCFVAGCHKWLYGPRGTGFVWAKPAVAPYIDCLFPTMSDKATWGGQRTPGGFHSFEHRWALAEAFDFHLDIGKERVTSRIHSLNRQLKEGLAKMDGITLHTPMDERLSAGMVCFDIRGAAPAAAVEHLWKRGIIASQTPYEVSYVRIAAGIINSADEVERALRAIRELT